MLLPDVLNGMQFHIDGLARAEFGEDDVGIGCCWRILLERLQISLFALGNPF